MGERLVIRRLEGLVLAIAGLFLLIASHSASGAVKVAASIFPIADMVRQVAGERAEVLTILPPGTDPHTFEPPDNGLQEAAKSRILFTVGAGLEDWMEKAVRPDDLRQATVLDLSEGLPLIRNPSSRETSRRIYDAAIGIDRDDKGDRANPHYWLDPVLARSIVDKIESALSAAMPDSREFFTERAAAYRSELDLLHDEAQQRVAQFKSRRLGTLTSHNSWSYFFKRYGLEEVSLTTILPMSRKSSPRYLAYTARKIRKLGLKAVLGDPWFSSESAQIISREAGVKFLILDPVGGTAPEKRSYLELMRHNLKILEAGMQ